MDDLALKELLSVLPQLRGVSTKADFEDGLFRKLVYLFIYLYIYLYLIIDNNCI